MLRNYNLSIAMQINPTFYSKKGAISLQSLIASQLFNTLTNFVTGSAYILLDNYWTHLIELDWCKNISHYVRTDESHVKDKEKGE